MIRTGEEYRAGLGDGREIWIYGKRVSDVTARPAFKPGVDLKARMYDMAHEPAWAAVMSYQEGGHYTHCLWAYRGRQQRPKCRRHSTQIGEVLFAESPLSDLAAEVIGFGR